MLKYILFFSFATSLFSTEPQAEQETIQESRNYTPKVECLVLEDENSILCKFEIIIDPVEDQMISLKWINVCSSSKLISITPYCFNSIFSVNNSLSTHGKKEPYTK